MTTAQQKQKAIQAYKDIVYGKVEGFRIPKRIIKVGSITFIP